MEGRLTVRADAEVGDYLLGRGLGKLSSLKGQQHVVIWAIHGFSSPSFFGPE